MEKDKYPGLLQDVYNYFVKNPKTYVYTGTITRRLWVTKEWNHLSGPTLHSAVITRCKMLVKKDLLDVSELFGREYRLKDFARVDGEHTATAGPFTAQREKRSCIDFVKSLNVITKSMHDPTPNLAWT